MTDTTNRASGDGTEAEDAQTVLPKPFSNLFKVVQVEKAEVPEGGEGRDWYRYVLESGRSTITGQRCGSIEDVTAYATHYAEQLNARKLKTQSTWTPRSKKPG